eukprot:Partr_v1_DN24463_c0_g1_i1_m66448 putative Methyltransferase
MIAKSIRTPIRQCHSLLSRSFSTSSPSPDGKTTHFGFRQVPESDKESLVGHVFHNVAAKYDLMNDAMSVGVHRLWKNRFVDILSPAADSQILDVAGGTGDVAFRTIDHIRRVTQPGQTYSAHVTVLDINQSMLDVGKARADRLGYAEKEVSWTCANAENLSVFADESFDAYTIAFGIRNCTHMDAVVREAYRVLKPGGRFMCMEFGKVNNSAVGTAYDLFSFEVIPRLGQLLADDRDSYQYLVESIRKFPAQPIFAQLIADQGFKHVEWEDLSFGIAAIHSGWKV